MSEAKQNTDVRLYTDDSGNEVFHTQGREGLGINVGGLVIVKPAAAWHALAAKVDRLTAQVAQMHKDANEAEREFSREARAIADEARWEERQRADGDYGSY